MANTLHRIFVYGTLKRGQPNHFRLLDSRNGVAKLLGTARLVQKYPLIVGGCYNIPALLDREGEGKEVHGELLDVDDRMLKALDDLEEHPKIYKRKKVQCVLDERLSAELSDTETAGVIPCETYVLYDFLPELLSHPHLSSYSNDPGRRYESNIDRDHHNFIWWRGMKIDQ